MTHTIETVSQQLLQDQILEAEALYLHIGNCKLELQSNSKALLDMLRSYFSDCDVLGSGNNADIQVIAIESQPLELDIDFVDWRREPGKTGRKDQFFDIVDGRVVRKFRTGMVFLQSEAYKIAAGPCIENDNQVINFINSQYMNWLQHRDWLICHASGLTCKINGRDKGFAIAGFSGGGKSTLMLKMMNHSVFSYVTNDRLFIKKHDEHTQMLGIPKLPRINPGTIVGNPVLHELLSADELARYKNMETSELWHIEEKTDVPVSRIYGHNRICKGAELEAFIVLNWARDASEPLSLNLVDLSQRRELLQGIMKSSGPFYQYLDGHFEEDVFDFDEEKYLAALTGISVYEVKGCIDFEKLTERFMATFE